MLAYIILTVVIIIVLVMDHYDAAGPLGRSKLTIWFMFCALLGLELSVYSALFTFILSITGLVLYLNKPEVIKLIWKKIKDF